MEENQDNKDQNEREEPIKFDYNPLDSENKEDKNDKDDDFGLPKVNFEPIQTEPEAPLPPRDIDEPSQTHSSKLIDDLEDEEPFVKKPMEKKPEPLYVKKPLVHEEKSHGTAIFMVILLLVLSGVAFYLLVVEKVWKNDKNENIAATTPLDTSAVFPTDTSGFSTPEVSDTTGTSTAVGVVEKISQRTGRYFIVAGSFFDGDNATDFSNKLSRNGVNAKIIEPAVERKGFFKVAVGDFDSFDDAANKIPELQSNYSEKLWVYKY